MVRFSILRWSRRTIGPITFALHQNYPNPFNPSTTLSFDIGYSTFVILKVYDVLGREVATLVNGWKEPETYHVELKADDLAGGVYLSRRKAGNTLFSGRWS